MSLGPNNMKFMVNALNTSSQLQKGVKVMQELQTKNWPQEDKERFAQFHQDQLFLDKYASLPASSKIKQMALKKVQAHLEYFAARNYTIINGGAGAGCSIIPPNTFEPLAQQMQELSVEESKTPAAATTDVTVSEVKVSSKKPKKKKAKAKNANPKVETNAIDSALESAPSFLKAYPLTLSQSNDSDTNMAELQEPNREVQVKQSRIWEPD